MKKLLLIIPSHLKMTMYIPTARYLLVHNAYLLIMSAAGIGPRSESHPEFLIGA